jgi:hypothetical protein
MCETHFSRSVSFLRDAVLAVWKHPFFDILSQGLTRVAGIMYEESFGREGIEMREVR